MMDRPNFVQIKTLDFRNAVKMQKPNPKINFQALSARQGLTRLTQPATKTLNSRLKGSRNPILV